jgi:hypothetical protein
MRALYSIIGLLIYISCLAQETSTFQKQTHFSITGTYGFGNVLPTSPFVQGDNLYGKPIETYQYLSVKALWQNPGYTHWQRVYRSPYYGIGLSKGDFFNSQEVGYPISCYGILGLPIKRWNNLEAFTEFQFGITGNWEHYDSITNPMNIVIGGSLTVHLDIGFKVLYNIDSHFDIGAGLSFIHFSNGGFERPNRGFNIYSPSLEFRYRFAERPDYKNVARAEKLKKTNDLLIMLGYGDYQLVEHELDTNYFAFGGISFIYFNQLSNAFRLGGGTDLNYWWGLNANADGTYAGYSFENITIGLILQPELVINKLTLVGGIGIYAHHRNYGNFNMLYQRLGVRFDVYRNSSIGINIRAINFMLAEVLEFNYAYRFCWEQ